MTPDALASEKAAIAELIARYNFVIDHNDFQGWADCFTPDGIFDGKTVDLPPTANSTVLPQMSNG